MKKSMIDLLNTFNNSNDTVDHEKIKQDRIKKIERANAEKIIADKKALELKTEQDQKALELKAIQDQKEAELKAIQDQKEADERNRPKVTFVMTACGRPDLMEQTLDSFFKFNDHPIERFIITEDSADPDVFLECKKLNDKKYQNKLEFIFNEKKLGQAKSIDLAYSKIETEYIFHCEEDWEFTNPGFIEKSIVILNHETSVLQAWIRPKSDGILNDIESEIQEINGVRFRNVLPKSFMVKNGIGPGKDLIVRDYMGFSWNPGVKRLHDYKLLNKGYSKFQAEHEIDSFYRSHSNGYKIVSISDNDTDGFVKHIGWGRRADDPIYDEKKDGPQDLEAAMLAARQKREADKKRAQDAKDAKLKAESSKVLTPKVSVVMQVYLGDYPGSRADSVIKFHRAVKSFLNQKYNKSELIIVSDGCDIATKNYMEYYKDMENIKFAYVDKNGLPNMYTSVLGGNKYYRGVPRQVGVAMADGGLITYMDSDDILLPEFLYKIVIAYNNQPDAMWLMNDSWLDHTNIMSMPAVDAIDPYENQPVYDIASLNCKFVQTKVKDGLIVNTPWLLTHRNNLTVKWEDVYSGISEDVHFGRQLRQAYKGQGFRFSAPTYMRCHYSGLWDV